MVIILDGPNSGDVRLFYANYNTNYYYGIVEVYLSDDWGTVANDGSWSIEDGQVVCRQLGFDIQSKLYSIYMHAGICIRVSTFTCVTQILG